MNQVNQQQKNYTHVYTEEELSIKESKLARATIEVKKHLLEMAETKEEIKAKQGLISALADQIEKGEEIRNKAFNVIVNEDMKIVQYQDPDTMEFVDELEHSTDGYQRDLLDGSFPDPNGEEE